MFKRIIKLSIILILINSMQVGAISYRKYVNYLSNKLELGNVLIKESEKLNGSYAIPSKKIIYIKTNRQKAMVLLSIAHEIYHIKQYQDNNKVFNNYFKDSVDFKRYFNQRVERQARGFSYSTIRELMLLGR